MGGYLHHGAICQEVLHYNGRMHRGIIVKKEPTAFQHWGLTLQICFNNLSGISTKNSLFATFPAKTQPVDQWTWSSTSASKPLSASLTMLFCVPCSNTRAVQKVSSHFDQESVAWPSCNKAASQRKLYCASVNSHSPVGLVSWQWDSVDWACILCDRRIHKSPPFQWQF